MNNPLAVRIFLLMKLSLDLFGIEVLEQIRLKIEARERLEMMRDTR
jgi:hypothetical protein